jgi:hypothetical protein
VAQGVFRATMKYSEVLWTNSSISRVTKPAASMDFRNSPSVQRHTWGISPSLPAKLTRNMTLLTGTVPFSPKQGVTDMSKPPGFSSSPIRSKAFG